jgi:hypothetical protein
MRSSIAAGCAAVMLVGAVSAYSANPRAGIFGAQGHPEARQLVRDGGFGFVRFRLLWATAQFAPPTLCDPHIDFDNEGFEDAVNRAREDGLDIVATVRGTPWWSAGGTNGQYPSGKDDNSPPLDAAHFRNYTREVARHFCGRVKYFDLWNQPRPHRTFWDGSVAQFRELILEPGIQGVHEGCPSALVVAPSTGSVGGDIDIGRWVREDGDGAFIPGIDVYSFHNQGGVDEQLTALDQMNQWCNNHPICSRYMLTEFGDNGPYPGAEMVDVLQRCESRPLCVGAVIFYLHAGDFPPGSDERTKCLLNAEGLIRDRFCVVEKHNTGVHTEPCPCSASKPGCAPGS